MNRASYEDAPYNADLRVLKTVTELAARWRRAHQRVELPNRVPTGTSIGDIATAEWSDHTSGRCEGYVQAIALLLDQPVPAVRTAITDRTI